MADNTTDFPAGPTIPARGPRQPRSWVLLRGSLGDVLGSAIAAGRGSRYRRIRRGRTHIRLAFLLVPSFGISICAAGCGTSSISVQESTVGSAQSADAPAALASPYATTPPDLASVSWSEPSDTGTPGYRFRASQVRLGYSTVSNLPLDKRGQLNVSFRLENLQTDRPATAPAGWTLAYATSKWQQLGAIANETEKSACEPIKGHPDYCIAGSVLSGSQGIFYTDPKDALFYSEWWNAGSNADYSGVNALQPPTINPSGVMGVTVYGRTFSGPVSHGDVVLVMVDRDISANDSFDVPLSQAEAGIDVVVFVMPDGSL